MSLEWDLYAYHLNEGSSVGNPKYSINGSDKNFITLEAIVTFTYALENTNPDLQNNPFDGVLNAYDARNYIYRYDK